MRASPGEPYDSCSSRCLHSCLRRCPQSCTGRCTGGVNPLFSISAFALLSPCGQAGFVRRHLFLRDSRRKRPLSAVRGGAWANHMKPLAGTDYSAVPTTRIQQGTPAPPVRRVPARDSLEGRVRAALRRRGPANHGPPLRLPVRPRTQRGHHRRARGPCCHGETVSTRLHHLRHRPVAGR